jgi:hypothetical protein
MADEQAKEMAETPEENLEEQLPEEVETASEGEKTPTESGKGDLSIALKEERTKRQELERKLQDPYFVYEKAKELGLAGPEAETGVPYAPEPSITEPPPSPMPNIYGTVKEILAYEEACKEFPQAKTDKDLAAMVDGLVIKGMKPADAVKFVQKQFNKAVEEAKVEGAKQKETEISAKEKAQTASTASEASTEAAEIARLREQARSLDPRVQKKAMAELIKRQLKEEKII